MAERKQTTYTPEDMERATHYVMESVRMLDENHTQFNAGRAQFYIQKLTPYSDIQTVGQVIGMLSDETRLRDGLTTIEIEDIRRDLEIIKQNYDGILASILADKIRPYSNGKGNYADWALGHLEQLAKNNERARKEGVELELEITLKSIRREH